MLFEILACTVVLVYIISKLEARHFESARKRAGLGVADEVKTEPVKKPRLALTIAGTSPVDNEGYGYVKSFGLNPKLLRDLRMYTSETPMGAWPAQVTATLKSLYDEGHALGLAVVDLLFHGKPLPQGQAVYFALLEYSDQPRVFAYVDRVR